MTVAKGVMIVSSHPVNGREAEFNDWYSNVHIAEVSEVPGFVSARRFAPANEGGPYIAIYEMESEDLDQTLLDLRAVSESGGMNMSDSLSRDPAPSAIMVVEIARFPK